MPNPNRNQRTPVGISKTKFVVYIREDFMSEVREEDERSDVYVETIQHRAGSGLIEAVLISDIAKQNRRLENLSLSENASRKVEVWTLHADNGERENCLFWGEIVAQQIAIRNGSEAQLLIARVLPYHFGEPLKGIPTWGSFSTEPEVVDHDLEFNPVINQKLLFNKLEVDPEGFQTPGQYADISLPMDPEVFNDADANLVKDALGGTLEEWSLVDIVETLIWWNNENETNIKNLPRDGLESRISDPPRVTDLILPRENYLPSTLDLVLQPYGFNWYVEIFVDEAGNNSQRTIEIYKRGDGTKKTIDLQNVGEDYNRILSNLEETILDIDISTLANRVTGQSALIQNEVTAELWRAWDQNDDGNQDHNDANNPIGRKLAASEGADYFRLRDEIVTAELGSNYLLKRRPMEDCLTLRDGERIPPLLQYSDDDGGTWNDAPQNWAFRPLKNEIGVYFTDFNEDGNAIPDEVLDADIRFRITCTITSDKRHTYTKQADDSPNSNDLELVMDLSNRFQIRKRMDSGEFASVLTGDVDEQDDEAALEEFVDSVGLNEQSAQVTAELPLHGILTDYRIGDLITEIRGRNISLNRNSRSSSQKRYLQIVGIKYANLQKQNTILTVAPYDM